MSDDNDDEDPFEHLSAEDAPDDADPFSELDGPDERERPGEDVAPDHDEGEAVDPSRSEGSGPGRDDPGPGRMPDDPFAGDDEPGDADQGDGEALGDDWTSPGAAGPDAGGDRGGEDPFDRMDGAADPTGVDDPPRADDSAGADDATGVDDPLSTVGETGPGIDDEDDPFAAFESVEIEGEFDPDQVWQTLSDVESAGKNRPGEKVYYEVSKHKFCERCEHFSGPPDTTCTYEGAEIVEFLDMETVRLVNCPVVAEYRQLGEDETID